MSSVDRPAHVSQARSGREAQQPALLVRLSSTTTTFKAGLRAAAFGGRPRPRFYPRLGLLSMPGHQRPGVSMHQGGGSFNVQALTESSTSGRRRARVAYPNWTILATDGTSELSTATA